MINREVAIKVGLPVGAGGTRKITSITSQVGQEPHLVGGRPTPVKNDGLKVSWDDEDLPTEWKHKIHVPNHQPAHVW